ncbi:MAG: electron transport complex subunit RsxG [Pseudomonadota bacterium]
MTPLLRSATRAALVLLGFAIVGTTVLAFTYNITHAVIKHNEDAARLKLISETLVPGSYDNNPLHDALLLPPHKLLGTTFPSHVWCARKAGVAVALVLEVVAPDGYSGDINMLVGVDTHGRIIGVRVVSDKETPGLGDYIDVAKSAWIHIFDGKTLDNPDRDGWKVKKDGGQFDYMAGATISPRAVVKAVHHALQYEAAHRKALYAPVPHLNTPPE